MSLPRKSWTEEEDSLLLGLVAEKGVTRWGLIAKTLKTALNLHNRTGKQCRERWHNHLNPNINKDSWTEQEKIKILELHKAYGNRWSKISQHLEGRTDNAVKNFYYSHLRKKIRKIARNKSHKKFFNLENVTDPFIENMDSRKSSHNSSSLENNSKKALKHSFLANAEVSEDEAPLLLYTFSQSVIKNHGHERKTEKEENNDFSLNFRRYLVKIYGWDK